MQAHNVFMKLKVAQWFAIALFATSVLMVEAAYTGPGSNVGSTTVSAILKQPQDDMRVVLKGKLVRKVKHETYMFSDGTGEILADIDDKDFPAQPVDSKTKVEIMGEVDVDRRSGVEIDVKSLRIIGQ